MSVQVIKKARPNKSHYDKPLVSIAIPVYNRESLVSNAIKSAIAQTYPFTEIVISDNCSTDSSLSVILQEVQTCDNATVVRTSSNLGPVKNWLNSINYCSGQYVMILFSDDVLRADCIEQLVSRFSPGLAFVACAQKVTQSLSDIEAFPIQNDASKTVSPLAVQTYPSWFGLIRYALGKRMPVSPGSCIFRKELLVQSLTSSLTSVRNSSCIKTGAGPDIRIYLDALLSNRRYLVIDEQLVAFLGHRDSITQSNHLQVMLLYKFTIDSYFQSLPFPYNFIRLIANTAQRARHYMHLPSSLFRQYAQSKR